MANSGQLTPVARRAVAEYLSALLLSAVVLGSGIAAQQLSPTDVGQQLLENAAATAVGLYVLILILGPVSGAHFNPVVTLAEVIQRRLPPPLAGAYLAAQVVGCVSGAVLANLMFAAPVVAFSHTDRATWPHTLAEVVATSGLILVIFALVHTGRTERIPAAVGAYIGAAYWFTSSTSFANPAITIVRMFSDTFAGIAPASVLPFLAAQLAGGLLGLLILRLLYPTPVGDIDQEVRDDRPARRRLRGIPPRARR